MMTERHGKAVGNAVADFGDGTDASSLAGFLGHDLPLAFGNLRMTLYWLDTDSASADDALRGAHLRRLGVELARLEARATALARGHLPAGGEAAAPTHLAEAALAPVPADRGGGRGASAAPSQPAETRKRDPAHLPDRLGQGDPAAAPLATAGTGTLPEPEALPVADTLASSHARAARDPAGPDPSGLPDFTRSVAISTDPMDPPDPVVAPGSEAGPPAVRAADEPAADDLATGPGPAAAADRIPVPDTPDGLALSPRPSPDRPRGSGPRVGLPPRGLMEPDGLIHIGEEGEGPPPGQPSHDRKVGTDGPGVAIFPSPLTAMPSDPTTVAPVREAAAGAEIDFAADHVPVLESRPGEGDHASDSLSPDAWDEISEDIAGGDGAAEDLDGYEREPRGGRIVPMQRLARSDPDADAPVVEAESAEQAGCADPPQDDGRAVPVDETCDDGRPGSGRLDSGLGASIDALLDAAMTARSRTETGELSLDLDTLERLLGEVRATMP